MCVGVIEYFAGPKLNTNLEYGKFERRLGMNRLGLHMSVNIETPL